MSQYNEESKDYINLITNDREFSKATIILKKEYSNSICRGSFIDFICDMSIKVGYKYRKLCVDWCDYNTKF